MNAVLRVSVEHENDAKRKSAFAHRHAFAECFGLIET